MRYESVRIDEGYFIRVREEAQVLPLAKEAVAQMRMRHPGVRVFQSDILRVALLRLLKAIEDGEYDRKEGEECQ